MDIMNSKILIVGGAGYIGGFLTDLLDTNGHDITVYDNLLYEDRYLKPVKFIFGDVRDYKKLGNIIHSYDSIIWLAGIVGDQACAIHKNTTQEVNVDSVKWLVDNYKGKIIFTSTCSVYGINDDLIDESAKPNPLSHYALSKLEAESYIIRNCENYTIFRLGTLFGLGDNFSRIRLDLVVNALVYKALSDRMLPVYGGEQWRPMLHVKDVAQAIKFCLENKVFGLYNLAYKNFRIRDIAEEISSHVENVDTKFTDIPFEDLRNYKIINNKMLSTGWTPKYSLKDGINQMSLIIKGERIKDLSNIVYSNEKHLRKAYQEARRAAATNSGYINNTFAIDSKT
jgi:nucleoside-diphosphate-sugar epimerase